MLKLHSSYDPFSKENRIFFFDFPISAEIIDSFSSIKQSSIAVNMDLADSLSSVELEE